MLYEISFIKEDLQTLRDTEKCLYYSVGNSKQDAYKLWRKRNHLGPQYTAKNLSIRECTRFNTLENESYSLYCVRYDCWKRDFNGTYESNVIVIGRCEEEAIVYAKAFLDNDTMNHIAKEIKNTIIGKQIILQDVDVETFEPVFL